MGLMKDTATMTAQSFVIGVVMLILGVLFGGGWLVWTLLLSQAG